MISQIAKYLSLILLALSLVILPSCIGKENTTTGAPPPAATNEPRLGLPIDCTLGQNCYIMHYVDRDPAKEKAVDFACGRQTYDGHNGTDFGIIDERAMAAGVAVKAAAAGRVLRIRDGEPDRRVEDQATKAAVEGKECGNAAVIDHGNGWETYYCHMRQGSVVVKPGTEVQKGTVLGMVGESGLASFPHVHLSVFYQGKEVDPFVGPDAGSGCNVTRNPLWEQSLDYVPTGPIRAGFAPQQPDMDKLWEGIFSETVLPKDIPALLFWIQAYGILEGDEAKFMLTAPNGQVIVDNKQQIDKPSRYWLGYVGKRNNPDRPIIPGVWRGDFQLMRGDRVLIDLKREVEVR